MKFTLLFRGLIALLFALSASPTMACGPEYYVAMTQFVAEAKVIAILDPADVNPALLTESEEEDASIWMETPMTFLKGSVTDTVFTNNHFQWLVQDAKTHPGCKIFLMLIPITEENEYLVYNITNNFQVIEEAHAAVYEARLRELIALTEQKKVADLWRWVIRGITEYEMTSPVWQDANNTLYYTEFPNSNINNEEEFIEPMPAGLPFAAFPEDLRPVLGNYTIAQLELHKGKSLTLINSILDFSIRAGIKDLAAPCIQYLHAALELYENNRKQGLTAAIIAQQQEESGEVYDFFPVHTYAVEVAKSIENCKGITPLELAEANRSLLYLLRLRTEYPELFISASRYGFADTEEAIGLLHALVAPGTNGIPEAITTPVNALYELSYDDDPAPLLGKIETALRAFTLEVAAVLDMCSDPYLTALTGERNWWGCHLAETKLATFVLAGAASATGDPALAIAAAPNPIPHSQCTLEWKTASDQPRVRLALVDANGREVWSQSHEQVRYAPVQQAVLSLPVNLAAGTYLLKVQYPDQIMEVKVLVE